MLSTNLRSRQDDSPGAWQHQSYNCSVGHKFLHLLKGSQAGPHPVLPHGIAEQQHQQERSKALGASASSNDSNDTEGSPRVSVTTGRGNVRLGFRLYIATLTCTRRAFLPLQTKFLQSKEGMSVHPKVLRACSIVLETKVAHKRHLPAGVPSLVAFGLAKIVGAILLSQYAQHLPGW